MGRPALLTEPEVADLLGTSVRHVRDLRYRRRIPFIKVGRQVRFDPKRIDAWLTSNTVESH